MLTALTSGLYLYNPVYDEALVSKEKALCDKVFYTKDIPIRSKSAMVEFLEDDLRIDLDELAGSDIEVFREYY